MAVNGQAPWRGATVQEAVNGKWCAAIWDGKSTMIVAWRDARGSAISYLNDHFPQYPLYEYDKWQEKWRTTLDMPKIRLLGGREKAAQIVKPYQGRSEQTYSSKLELLEGETPETLVAPVAIAKRLGLPPQYVYQVISKGRIETFGERPKRVRIRDVAKHYRKELIPYANG